MTTLDQLAANDYIKVLNYGPSGTGKTVLGATFPGPILYMDFDHKISSAARFFKDKPEILKGIHVEQFAHLTGAAKIHRFEAVLKDINAQVAKNQLQYKTIALDSLTTFSHYMLEHYRLTQSAIKRPHPDLNAMQDYQLLDKHLTQIITGLLSLSCNIYVTGHMATEKDETTGGIESKPLMAGKFADKLPIFFEEVYVSKVDDKGEYVLQTKSDSRVKCRTQRNLPSIIKSNYQAIKGQ